MSSAHLEPLPMARRPDDVADRRNAAGIATRELDLSPMNQHQAVTPAVGPRRCWSLAAGVAVRLAVGGCGSADEPGSIPLLRTPHLGTPITMSKAGHLKASPTGDCLMLYTDEEFPYSMIFEETLAIEVKNDQLYIDEKEVGPVTSAGVPVAALGRDGPTSYYPDEGDPAGPVDRACNQMQPMVAEQIRVLP